MTLTEIATDPAVDPSTTIVVCITCRRPGDPEDLFRRPGLAFAAAMTGAAQGTGVAVKRVRCLANCKRGLSAAVRRDGAWTYVFGDLEPSDAPALIEGARLLGRAADGVMPWRGRPAPLKRGLVARVPPTDYEEVE